VHHALYTALFCLGLFVCILLSLEAGRRFGSRARLQDPGLDAAGNGAVEGAVFGLLGLLIAFTFSGAATRFEARRHLLTEEVNAIGTAYLRVDLLGAEAQPAVRELFRRYIDARIELYQRINDAKAEAAESAEVASLQKALWSAAIKASSASTAAPDATKLLVPALNAMIDITTTRMEARQNHPPLVIFAMLVALSMLGGVLIGYELSGRANREWLHMMVYAAVLSVTLYVILDLEYPRRGLVRIDAADELLVQLREDMR
jgi:hypothetical protein